MAELQDSYRNRVIVAKKEMADAKARHESLYKDYLSYEMTDKELIKFIGDNLLFALFIIYAYRTSEYTLISEGYDHHIRDITGVLENKDVIIPSSFEEEELVQSTIRILKTFYDSANPMDIIEIFDCATISNYSPLFYTSETEYLDDWEYTVNYSLSPHYRFFYQRISELFLEHGIEILSDAFDGIHLGIYDMITVFWNFSTKGFDIDKNIPRYEYLKHPDIIKKLIAGHIKKI